MAKTVDFTDIDVYPRYWCYTPRGQKNRTYMIRSIIIEDVMRQTEGLLSKKTQLLVGDYIEVDVKFGHNTANKIHENWIDVRIKGKFKVINIIPNQPFENEIELVVEEKSATSLLDLTKE